MLCTTGGVTVSCDAAVHFTMEISSFTGAAGAGVVAAAGAAAVFASTAAAASAGRFPTPAPRDAVEAPATRASIVGALPDFWGVGGGEMGC